MYTTLDTTAMLALARQHQADVKASFPRKLRKHHPDVSTPAVITSLARIDFGSMSIPAPRQPERERERTVA